MERHKIQIVHNNQLFQYEKDLLAVPCNTAHHFIDRFRADLPIPLVHIVEATVDAARRRSPQGAWLLSTSGTRACGIYPACAERRGYRFLHPSEEGGRRRPSKR